MHKQGCITLDLDINMEDKTIPEIFAEMSRLTEEFLEKATEIVDVRNREIALIEKQKAEKRKGE